MGTERLDSDANIKKHTRETYSKLNRGNPSVTASSNRLGSLYLHDITVPLVMRTKHFEPAKTFPERCQRLVLASTPARSEGFEPGTRGSVRFPPRPVRRPECWRGHKHSNSKARCRLNGLHPRNRRERQRGTQTTWAFLKLYARDHCLRSLLYE